MPTLVVQMGHAGRTTGATGAPGEQAFTQAVGASCARLLDGRGGWRVRLIVADPGLDSYRGDAFVAVHADGNNNPAVRGASVGYQNDPGAGLAHAWHDAYVRRGFTGPWHRDNYTDNLHYYYGVTNAIKVGNRRACIVEAGTITNADDRALMLPDRVALAIGDAVGIPHGVPAVERALPPEPPITGRVEEMIITNVHPPNNRAAILSGGRLIDISDDAHARDNAQHAINAQLLAEITVTDATWDRMLGKTEG